MFVARMQTLKLRRFLFDLVGLVEKAGPCNYFPPGKYPSAPLTSAKMRLELKLTLRYHVEKRPSML